MVASDNDIERAASGSLKGDRLNGRQSTSSPSCLRRSSDHGIVALLSAYSEVIRLRFDNGA